MLVRSFIARLDFSSATADDKPEARGDWDPINFGDNQSILSRKSHLANITDNGRVRQATKVVTADRDSRSRAVIVHRKVNE